MDLVGCGAGQALGPVRWCMGRNLSSRHSQGVAPPASHRRLPRMFSLPVPTFPTECTLLRTRSFLVVCPAFSALQTPLGVVDELEQLEAVFSLLASYPYWITVKSQLLETLKASSAKIVSGVWGPASSLCNFLWVSGIVWMIKHMASSVLPSVDSGSVWCLP